MTSLSNSAKTGTHNRTCAYLLKVVHDSVNIEILTVHEWHFALSSPLYVWFYHSSGSMIKLSLFPGRLGCSGVFEVNFHFALVLRALTFNRNHTLCCPPNVF